MKNFTRQRLSYKEKMKDDFKWAKDTIDSLLTDAINTEIDGRHYNRKLANYQLYNNILNQEDFERECNPLGLEVGQFKDTIQPYNKTYNKIQVLLGEELRRPFDYRVTVTDDEGIRSKLLLRNEMLFNTILQKVENTIAGMGMMFETDVDPSMLVEEKDMAMVKNLSFLSKKEVAANKLLKYLTKALNLKDIKNDAFKHGLISGEEFVYIGAENGNPKIEVLNPLGVFYHRSPEQKYIQDSLYAGYRTYMTSNDIFDAFPHLSEEDSKRIDDKSMGPKHYFRADVINSDMKYFHDDYYYYNQANFPYLNEGSYGREANSNEYWLVQHCEWKSQKKVGFINYVNMFGDEEMDMVSEYFEIPDFATKTKDPVHGTPIYMWEADDTTFTYHEGWISEVWEGTRIGDNIYANVGPKDFQFRSLDNPYKVKLGYHGVIYNAMNAPSVSIMDRMKPFQYLYFIVAHKMKKLIAQDKGPIFHFDVSMVDPAIGLEKTLYYLTELNIDFYNPLQNAEQPGWSQRGKVSSTASMSTSQHIANYIQILNAIDHQIADVAGITKQREGQITPQEAVTNAHNNIAMSAVITEVYFQSHNKLWEQCLNSLVQVAQNCYKHKSFKRSFILDDMSIETLNITPDNLDNADFGVFVTNSPKETQLFETLRNLSQAFIQNDKAKISDVIAMLKSDSIAEIEALIKTAEQQNEQMQQQMMQQQMEAQAQAQQAQQEFELEKQARELETKLRIAEMDSLKFQKDQDINNNQIPDQFEVEKFRTESRLKTRQLDIEEKKVNAAIKKDNKK